MGVDGVVVQVDAVGAEGFDQRPVGLLLALEHFGQLFGNGAVMLRLYKKAKDMQLAPPVLRGKLHAADGLHAAFFPGADKFRQARYGVVVAKSNGTQPLAFGQANQLCRGQCTVRICRMGMQIAILCHSRSLENSHK